MQHDVGRPIAQVVAAPDHVAQVVVHAFARVEGQQGQRELQLPGQGTGQVNVQPLHVVGGTVRKRRVVLVDGDFQQATGANARQVGQLGLRMRQRQAHRQQQRQAAPTVKAVPWQTVAAGVLANIRFRRSHGVGLPWVS